MRHNIHVPRQSLESSDEACCSVVNSSDRNISLSKRLINVSERSFSSMSLQLVKGNFPIDHNWDPSLDDVGGPPSQNSRGFAHQPLHLAMSMLKVPLTPAVPTEAQYLLVKPDNFQMKHGLRNLHDRDGKFRVTHFWKWHTERGRFSVALLMTWCHQLHLPKSITYTPSWSLFCLNHAYFAKGCTKLQICTYMYIF